MTTDRGSFRRATLALGLCVQLSAVGCVAARPSDSPPVLVEPSAFLPSPSKAPNGSAPAVAPSPVTTPPPSASPTALPGVVAAPAGPWSRIQWLDAGAVVPLGPSNVEVYGWSGGFVAVAASGGDDGTGTMTPTVVMTSGSDDGLRWSAPQSIDASGLDGGVEIVDVLQGPQGLLLVGDAYAGTCGGPPWVSALWTSGDGHAWHRIALPKDFTTSRVETVDGGSAGFIATGLRSDGSTPGIWASQNGTAWRSLPLPRVSSGIVVVNGATSFAGGFVLAGAVLGPDGCGGATSLHPSLWWSADGARWTRDTIAGTSSADDASMSVRRISDHALVAVETTSKPPEVRAWVSADGRTWMRVDGPPTTLQYAMLSNGRSAAIVVDPESGVGAPTITALDDHLRLTEIAQGGRGPVASEDGVPWTTAIGPTGILAVSVDGRAAWLGVPAGS